MIEKGPYVKKGLMDDFDLGLKMFAVSPRNIFQKNKIGTKIFSNNLSSPRRYKKKDEFQKIIFCAVACESFVTNFLKNRK